jgi:hypothetical protein
MWSQERFNQVSWSSLDASICSKPDMFQVWLAKQCIRICATRLNMARIQGLLNDNCPNCYHPEETNDRLNRYPGPGRTLLFRDRVEKISRWIYKKRAVQMLNLPTGSENTSFLGVPVRSYLYSEEGGVVGHPNYSPRLLVKT